ncbi:probable cytochrome P450 12a5, mitochondrial isoform X3 [Patella vulgata]|uniref:probable cytochrome P450 12a5, mitochondrial isoform X3 n=1 Tax=Patella vulgata TaxID=6465 RepID=UPI00217FF224|nr:probable cytochrome P450 12a5, mitochondrial isoform X3 [Patella vulgata]
MNTTKLLRLYRYNTKLQFRHRSTATATSLPRVDNSNVNPKPYSEIPGPTGIYNIPKIGGMFLFQPFTKYNLVRFHELTDMLFDKYGPIVRLNLGNGIVLTSDPQDIELIYKSEGKYPKRPGFDLFEVYIERTKKAKNLAVLNGEKWAELRTQVQKKLVRPKSALHYIESQSEVANDLVDKLRSIDPDDVRELLFLYATESIAVVCFNKRLGILEGAVTMDTKEYLDNSKIFFTHINKGTVDFPFFKYFETPLYKKFKHAADKTYGFGKVQIEDALEKSLQMKKDGTWNPEEPNFLMSLLAEEKLSIEQVTSLVLDLLVGGTDSTAKTLEIFLYCLARHPEKQDNLQQEILKYMGRHGDLTADNLPDMKYLTACLKESFRMYYPLASGAARFLPVDIILSGYHIPKGTLIGMGNRKLLMNPKYVTNPTVYRPERWLRDDKGARADPIPSIGLIPFSVGVRNCIGRRFAEQEIYIAITKIVQNFKVSLMDDTSNPPNMIYETFGSFVQKPMFKFEERK